MQYSKRFLKQLSKLPSSSREKIEHFVFSELTETAQIELSGKIEKMKGYDDYYKIRFGSYRVGLYYKEDTLFIKLVMHRKDIYNYFP
ncbi:MAG: type II toxin-antitoxin system RelE/ParE family toxin [Calditrichales bacterium]|nr:type II toxin-antitoxin system RelE/ParE family toxin [Calditrichales bacterium]